MDFDLSTAILGIAALLFVVALLVLTVWAFKAVFGGLIWTQQGKDAKNAWPWSRPPPLTPTASSASSGATMSNIS